MSEESIDSILPSLGELIADDQFAIHHQTELLVMASILSGRKLESVGTLRQELDAITDSIIHIQITQQGQFSNEALEAIGNAQATVLRYCARLESKVNAQMQLKMHAQTIMKNRGLVEIAISQFKTGVVSTVLAGGFILWQFFWTDFLGAIEMLQQITSAESWDDPSSLVSSLMRLVPENASIMGYIQTFFWMLFQMHSGDILLQDRVEGSPQVRTLQEVMNTAIPYFNITEAIEFVDPAHIIPAKANLEFIKSDLPFNVSDPVIRTAYKRVELDVLFSVRDGGLFAIGMLFVVVVALFAKNWWKSGGNIATHGEQILEEFMQMVGETRVVAKPSRWLDWYESFRKNLPTTIAFGKGRKQVKKVKKSVRIARKSARKMKSKNLRRTRMK